MNRAARRQGNREKEHRESTLASRSMSWTRVLILAFVIYHLAHFTWGVRAVHPQFVPGDVAHNFVTAFRSPLVSTLYVVAMLILAPHLYHGVWSWMQTLGLSHPRYDALRHRAAAAVAVLILLGNVAMPLAVLSGLIRPRTSSAPAYAGR
jgi:succinate dehydrogenase / fumarate reductase cytochrome b subunit